MQRLDLLTYTRMTDHDIFFFAVAFIQQYNDYLSWLLQGVESIKIDPLPTVIVTTSTNPIVQYHNNSQFLIPLCIFWLAK